MTDAAEKEPLYSRFRDIVARSHRFLLTSHYNPDGDGIGSEIALARGLRKLGKEVAILNPSASPTRLRFMEEGEPFLDPASPLPAPGSWDVVVLLDANRWSRLGPIESAILAAAPTKVCIDHHPPQGAVGDLDIIIVEASSTGTLIYELLRSLGVIIDLAIATPIYVTIISDTGNFRYSNTTPEVHRIAAQFIELGLDHSALYDRIHNDRTPSKLRLLGECLERAEFFHGGSVVVIPIHLARRKELGVPEEDTHDFVDEIRLLRDSDVFASATETDAGEVRLSIRSRGRLDVNKLAQQLGGGGHARASGARVHGTLREAIDRWAAVCAPAVEALRNGTLAPLDDHGAHGGMG